MSVEDKWNKVNNVVVNDDYDSQDSEIEARLYAEIYYTNDIPEPCENIENNSISNCTATPNMKVTTGSNSNNYSSSILQTGEEFTNSIETQSSINASDVQTENMPEKTYSPKEKHVIPKGKKRTFRNASTYIENEVPSAITNNEVPETNKTPKKINQTLNSITCVSDTSQSIDVEVECGTTPKTKRLNTSTSSENNVMENISESSNTAKRKKSNTDNGNKTGKIVQTKIHIESDMYESNRTPKTKKQTQDNTTEEVSLIINEKQKSDNPELLSNYKKNKKRLLDNNCKSANEKNKQYISGEHHSEKNKHSAPSKEYVSKNSQKTSKRNCQNYVSDIIELSSESSDLEDNLPDLHSKYDVITTHQKQNTNETQKENDSDSDNSIFEVPIPRKPTPPLIVVKDSENETSEDETSEDESCSEHSEYNNVVDMREDNFSNFPSNSSHPDIHDSQLILNHTEIQTGVSSIAEIKRRSHSVTIPNECSKSPVQIPQNDSTITEMENNQRNVKNLTLQEYLFLPMSQKMKDFYNNSWGGENFDVDVERSKMSMNPNNWAILGTDMTYSFTRRRRYFGLKCTRCQQEGHSRGSCPEQPKDPSCHMCGAKGHYETRCPEKMCLNCGKRQLVYRKTCNSCQSLYCQRCNSGGHTEENCHDLWRRYHQTTKPDGIYTPQNYDRIMKPSHLLHCCNCTRQGHDWTTCRMLRWSQHFPTPSNVVNYHDGPDYQTIDNEPNGSIYDNTHSPTIQCTNAPVDTNWSNTSINESCNQESSIQNLTNIYQPQSNENEFHSENCKIIYEFTSPNDFTKGCKTSEMILDTIEGVVLSGLRDGSNVPSFIERINFTKVHLTIISNQNNQLLMKLMCPSKHHDSLVHLLMLWLNRNDEDKKVIIIPCLRRDLWLKKLKPKLDKFEEVTTNPLLICRKIFDLKNGKECNIPRRELRDLQRQLVIALCKENITDNNLLIFTKETYYKYSQSKSKKIGADTALKLHIFLNVLSGHLPSNLSGLMGMYCNKISCRWNAEMDVETNLKMFDFDSIPLDLSMEMKTNSSLQKSDSNIANSEKQNENTTNPKNKLTKSKKKQLKGNKDISNQITGDKNLIAMNLITEALTMKDYPNVLKYATKLKDKIVNRQKVHPTENSKLQRLIRKGRKNENKLKNAENKKAKV